MDITFINPGYTNAFFVDQVLLDQYYNKLKQICSHCLLAPRYPLFLKCGHLTCLPCLREYPRHRFLFEKIITCPICQQFCRLNDIYSYKMENKKCPKLFSMRMLKNAKLACTYAKCGEC